MSYPQRLLDYFLDLLFPIRCIYCGFSSDKRQYVCGRCLRSIQIRKSFECVGCKRATRFGQTCFECKKEYSIDNLFIACDYNDDRIKRIIKVYKYQYINGLALPIYGLLAKYLSWLTKTKNFNIFQNNSLIVPIPLSQGRLNERGFNQSELLAIEFGRHMQFETDNTLISREDAPHQAEIESKEERKNNVVGRFKYIGGNLSGRDIVLLDDVCTTGSTINECAKLLKQNGAGTIYALVIARG